MARRFYEVSFDPSMSLGQREERPQRSQWGLREVQT